MPKHNPGLATRAAVVATSTAAIAFLAVVPATTVAAAPAAPAPLGTASLAAPAAPVAPAALPAPFTPPVRIAPAPVTVPVAPVALSTPAAHRPAKPAAPAEAATSSVVAAAMSKIGAPYRWGATGPHAFDCSGLVKWAFKDRGASLPRTSRAMSQTGTPVAKSDLRPGDLVFFYKPVSHVGIYIGDGKIVHASNKKSPVKVSDMGRMPFNSARRV